MADPNIPLDRLKAVRKICPIMTVHVHGSDECILRKAEYYRDSDIEEVIETLLRLAEEKQKAFDKGYEAGACAVHDLLETKTPASAEKERK